MIARIPTDKLNQWRNQIARLPEVQLQVAEAAAPAISGLIGGAFDAGQTVYGGARPAGKDGRKLSLHKSGDLRAQLRFIPRGRFLRCSLGVPYAKYQIRFGILPRGGAALPPLWGQALKRIADEKIAAHMNRGAG